MIEHGFALAGLLVCAALLLRMVLPARLRPGWDAFWRRRWRQLLALGPALQGGWQRLRRGRAARQQAAEAIARAQAAGPRRRPTAERDGNVIRPRQFGGRAGPRRSNDAGDDESGDRTLH